ncbi:MFS general substrate transporter [Piedraia hortae CBS 480.64]|uniref:MFS general substrate transporter n=1 Tax=Piedraia hortae CBS 480.64 TaxID=1314780 RepID=A0A6A7C8F0_9PEZI|nr:MFS general substrate transporter [Piedraia hortae CBS 480.64]
MDDERQPLLTGTIRLLTADEEIKLVPEPSSTPNDPLNWSAARKCWHTSLVLFITAFTAATSNDAGAGGQGMLTQLGISYGVEDTAAGVLFLGIGIWALLSSPLATLYGRRIVYMICLLFSLIGSLWFARTETVSDLIINQFFVGASSACGEAVAQLSLSDLFFQHRRGAALGLYVLAISIGTFLGPLIAGYIAADAWRWIGWTAVIITAVTIVVFYFGLEETAFDRKLQDTQTASFLETDEKIGDPATPLAEDRPRPYRNRIRLITPAPNLAGMGFIQYQRRFWATLKMLCFPAVLFSGLQWGAQDAWLSVYLNVEEDGWIEPPWNYGDQAVAIMNVPTLIGAVIGCIYGGWFSDIFVKWIAKRFRGGISEAEDRLWLLLTSAVLNPLGLILLGIGTGHSWSWPVPYVALGFIGFGWGCTGDLGMAYLMDAYPEMILEGMVGVAVINNGLASIFSFVLQYWLSVSGLMITCIACGGISFAIHLLTLPMIFWGKSCRRRTSKIYRNCLALRDG